METLVLILVLFPAIMHLAKSRAILLEIKKGNESKQQAVQLWLGGAACLAIAAVLLAGAIEGKNRVSLIISLLFGILGVCDLYYAIAVAKSDCGTQDNSKIKPQDHHP
jgi:UDP-N-acetylmuramyl pentapeptide phosphotransferase/UDP-N-acetylglucosamine-1-phosphate transferase